MKKFLETTAILFAMMGFWGMIYPDLCFTEGVCILLTEQTSGEEDSGSLSGNENGRSIVPWTGSREQAVSKIFDMDAEHIRLRSRLLDLWAGGEQERCGKEERYEIVDRGQGDVEGGTGGGL